MARETAYNNASTRRCYCFYSLKKKKNYIVYHRLLDFSFNQGSTMRPIVVEFSSCQIFSHKSRNIPTSSTGKFIQPKQIEVSRCNDTTITTKIMSRKCLLLVCIANDNVAIQNGKLKCSLIFNLDMNNLPILCPIGVENTLMPASELTSLKNDDIFFSRLFFQFEINESLMNPFVNFFFVLLHLFN